MCVKYIRIKMKLSLLSCGEESSLVDSSNGFGPVYLGYKKRDANPPPIGNGGGECGRGLGGGEDSSDGAGKSLTLTTGTVIR